MSALRGFSAKGNRKKSPRLPAMPRNRAAQLRRCEGGPPPGRVLDIIDTSDPDIVENEGTYSRDGVGVCKPEHRVFVRASPDVLGDVVRSAEAAVKARGRLGLMRIHGHGFPGYQSIWGEPVLAAVRGKMSEAQLARVVKDPTSRTAISYRNLSIIRPSLMRLAPLFSPGGELWLMGCDVGAKAEGRQLVNSLALSLGTIVKAGVMIQEAGNPVLNFTHEGTVIVGRPSGLRI